MKKVIRFIMLITILIYTISPFIVYASEFKDVSTYLKDGVSTDVDFTYEFNISDTFDILYSNKNIDDYIKEYIYSKIDKKYTVRINRENNVNNYTIYENGNEVYEGVFSYSLQKKLEIDLNDNNKIQSLEKYIKDNTKYSEMNILEISNDTYRVEINNIQNDFTVIFLSDNEKQKEEQNVSEAEESQIRTYTNINNSKPSVKYQTHVQNIGWQDAVSDGQIAGTSGKNLRQEAIKIKLENSNYEGNIEYKSHIQNIGWETYWNRNGEQSGTSGKALRLEAIQIKLTGEMEQHYDVYYKVHVQNIGWLDWAKNGESAGTIGYSYRLEAIQIILVEKGQNAPGEIDVPYIQKLVSYQTHIQNIGWQNTVYDGSTSGTSGQSKRLEAIRVSLSNQLYSGNIEYKSHIQNIGWETYWNRNGNQSGTSGKALRLEAIQIRLTGEMEKHYDIYYRVHSESFGWLDWAKNGESAGTEGYAYRLEAIQIVLVKKGMSAPGKTELPFIKKYISYQTHNSNVGWSSATQDGYIAGSIGKNLEAYKINLIRQNYSGNVNYSSYVNGIGWQSYVSNGALSGTTGQGRKIEAIKINLSGAMSENYDIYYSAYVSNVGWLDWAKNDQACGNIGYGNSIQAIKIRLVEKSSSPPGKTENIYSEERLKVNYSSYGQSSGWQNMVSDGAISGSTGKSRRLESIKIELNKKIISGSISYSTHLSNVGWTNYVSDGVQSGKVGNRIEAIKIQLTGNIAQKYDVYYRVHVSNVGWMGWTSNNSPAGTTGAGKSVEAIQVILVEKGSTIPSNDDAAISSSYLEAHWSTDSAGNRYYYDIYGNLVTGGSYQIGDTTHYFGPTGIYLGNKNLKVIDISAHNGYINWQQVASSGIYGVILRISAGCEQEDSRLAYNIEQVKKYNIPYGIYIYSYAENYNEGILYGQWTNKIISKYRMSPSLGIYLDLESNSVTSYMGVNEYTNVVKGFMSVVPSARLYTYTNYTTTALNSSYIKSLITWIADYRGYCGYTGSYRMWQYTSTGRISGVSGNVDISILYN